MSKFAGLGVPSDTASKMLIVHPITGQPLRNTETKEQAWIELLPTSSEAGRKHDRAIMDRNLKKRGVRVTAEEIENDTVAKLARLTRGWMLVTLSGAPLDVPFSETNAAELYGLSELAWLREQVADFISNLANFQTPHSQN